MTKKIEKLPPYIYFKDQQQNTIHNLSVLARKLDELIDQHHEALAPEPSQPKEYCACNPKKDAKCFYHHPEAFFGGRRFPTEASEPVILKCGVCRQTYDKDPIDDCHAQQTNAAPNSSPNTASSEAERLQA